jgi:flagellar biosynthesis protein FlhG
MAPQEAEGPRAAAWAITSGKGGVGKSTLSLNLGIALSAEGKRVLLVDADLGLANIDILLGISPEHNLQDLLHGRVSAFDVIVEGPEGLSVLPAASGISESEAWQSDDSARLGEELGRLERAFDLILIDTGAGISTKVTDFVLSADRVFVVATPEPTSIADAYAMVKVATGERPDLPVGLIVNRAKSPREAHELHAKFEEIVGRFLNISIDRIGHIVEDVEMGRATRNQFPVVLGSPESEAARCIKKSAPNSPPNSIRRIVSSRGCLPDSQLGQRKKKWPSSPWRSTAGL